MKLGRKIIAILLLLVALVEVNYLASRFSARVDMTADNIYSLSPGTRNLLSQIEEPLAFKLYYSKSAEELRVQFKSYASRVEEMLRAYAASADGTVTFEVIDPAPDTDEETDARRAGLTPQNLPSGDPVFFGLVATQGAEVATIPFLLPNREQFLEYDISRLVYSVQQFDKPRLGLISSLPLKAEPPMMPGQRAASDQIVIQEWANTYEIVDVPQESESLPEYLDVLAIVHPQNLGEKLLFEIDQFLLSGKPVFLALDPSSYYFRRMQQQQQMPGMMNQGENSSSDLPQLLKAWGITYDATQVVGDFDLASTVNTAQGTATNVAWLSMREGSFNTKAEPASALSTMLVLDAGSIEVDAERGYEVTPVLQSSPRSGNIAAMMINFMPAEQLGRQLTEGGEAKNIAVIVRGSFETAFPDGAPTAETNDEDTGETAPASLKKSASPTTLFIIADSDWLLDMTSVRRIAMINSYMPLNDNLVFASNTLEFLGGSEDLISIRGKGSEQRGFEVIRQMEVEAREEFDAEQIRLEERQTELQQKIQELLTNQTQSGQLVASPELQEAIDRFRAEEAEVRVALREIRRALRNDIESLEHFLTGVNLLIIPLLLLPVGIIFILSRGNRRKKA